MNPKQIFDVTMEMKDLFDEHLTAIVNDLAEEKGDATELNRAFAMRAANIVIKHAKWPADLADRLDKVSAYIKAHPEQAE